MTTIYLIRHSKSEKTNNIVNSDNLQIQNEKQFLSIDGEQLAKEKMDIDELKNIDVLYSSNYLRALGTAKYIAKNNNITIKIHEGFGERKFGVSSWDEIPNNFFENQVIDENYKIGNGESQLEVRNRMFESLNSIFEKDKRIVIVTHSTAMLFLLMKWCDVTSENISYKDKIISTTKIDNCDIFKLIFDDSHDLIEMQYIKQ